MRYVSNVIAVSIMCVVSVLSGVGTVNVLSAVKF